MGKWALSLLILLLGSGAVQVARDPAWPLVPLGGQTQAVRAYSDELLRDIGAKEGWQLQISSGDYEMIVEELQRGQLDAILTSLHPTGVLESQFSFSEPYLLTGPVLVVPQSSQVRGLQSLVGQIVGVRRGSPDVQIAARIPLVIIDTYDNEAQLLDALAQGRVEAALVPAIPTYAYLRNIYRGILRQASGPLNREGLRFVARVEDANLVEQFDRGLEKLDLEGLRRKWQLNPEHAPHTRPAPAR